MHFLDRAMTTTIFPFLRRPGRSGRAGATAALMLCGALAMPALAQHNHGSTHAHTHGQMELDLAVDAGTISVAIRTPLDNLVGFERAPKTDAERARVDAALAQLRAADQLFVVDPRGECKLRNVTLDATVLGLDQSRTGHAHGHSHAQPHSHAHEHDHDSEHAELGATIVFACAKADAARFIDVKLFAQFKRLNTIQAQVVSGHGQSRQILKSGAQRLSWGR